MAWSSPNKEVNIWNGTLQSNFEGTVTSTPINSTDLVNKEYVDLISINTGIDLYAYDDASDTGSYKQFKLEPSENAKVEGDAAIAGNSKDQLIGARITEVGINCKEVINTLTAGVYNFHVHMKAASANKLKFYAEFYVRTSGGTETLIGTTSESNYIETSETHQNVHLTINEEYPLTAGDRIVIKGYINNYSPSSNHIYIYVEGDTATRVSIRGLSFPASIGSVDNHDDVDTISDTPNKNEVLKWNGSNWVPAVYNASFTFSISGFSDAQSSTQLIGSGEWKAAGDITFTASYSNGPPDPTPYVSHSGWDNLNMTGDGYVGPTVSGEAVDYPGSVGSLTWTLHATDGETPDTANQSVTFINYLWYGTTEKTDTFTEADVEAGTEILSNDETRTWPEITTGAGEYMLISYPSRLGSVTFWVGGFEGGFEDAETVELTNSAGFTENYYVYRSTNANLGATVVTTT